MISQDERIARIEKSIETGERRAINYRNDRTPRPVKHIPLKYLLYNPHNGRIRSYTKSFESTFHELKPEVEIDKKIIEQYLYDSATNRNLKTLESLELNGQQESGIVTRDGVIIDGNRRAMLLNMISKKKGTEGFFNAIVLPDKLQDNEKEIVTLETSYQMGVDSKVDYNPIEKYIRCKELQVRHHYTVKEIADIMAEAETRITEWLDILSLMDEYLGSLGSPEVYTRLEKREGHFVDLRTYLKSYSNRHQPSVHWDYTSNDLQDLKKTYFSYIRLGIPVLRARVIAKPASANSFFCHKEIWVDFLNDYNAALQQYQEPSFNDVKANSPEMSNEQIIQNLDQMWRVKVEAQLIETLSFYETVLRDALEFYAPVKILKRILNSLGQINESDLINSNKTDVQRLLTQIDNKIKSLINLISK
jgi:hypothetical protein